MVDSSKHIQNKKNISQAPSGKQSLLCCALQQILNDSFKAKGGGESTVHCSKELIPLMSYPLQEQLNEVFSIFINFNNLAFKILTDMTQEQNLKMKSLIFNSVCVMLDPNDSSFSPQIIVMIDQIEREYEAVFKYVNVQLQNSSIIQIHRIKTSISHPNRFQTKSDKLNQLLTEWNWSDFKNSIDLLQNIAFYSIEFDDYYYLNKETDQMDELEKMSNNDNLPNIQITEAPGFDDIAYDGSIQKIKSCVLQQNKIESNENAIQKKKKYIPDATDLSANSQFLHSYSGMILNKVLTKLENASSSIKSSEQLPLGSLIFQPMEDKTVFIADLIRDSFKLYKRILVISPSINIGDQLFKELTRLNVVHRNEAVNYCMNNIKSIKTHDDFLEEISSLVVIHSKLCFDYMLHGVLQFEDFNLVIFEDLQQATDYNAQQLIKDFFFDRINPKRGILPEIIAIFNSRPPKSQNQSNLKNTIQERANDFNSESIGLTAQENLQVIEYYKNIQVIQQNKLLNAITTDQNVFVIIIESSEEIIQPQEGINQSKAEEKIEQFKGSRDWLVKHYLLSRHFSSQKIEKDTKHLCETQEDFKNESGQQVEALIVPSNKLRKITNLQINKKPYTLIIQSASIDFREAIMQLSCRGFYPPRRTLIIGDQSQERIDSLSENRIEAFKTKVTEIFTFELSLHTIKCNSETQAIKKRQSYEYYST